MFYDKVGKNTFFNSIIEFQYICFFYHILFSHKLFENVTQFWEMFLKEIFEENIVEKEMFEK